MDKEYIKNLLQRIINKEFSNATKRRINDYTDRLNCACPCCGDSDRNVGAKRGNLYLNKLLYICFNCGITMSFDKLCKRFNEQIDPEKKLEMIQHLDSVVSYKDYENNLTETNFSDLIDMVDIETVLNNNSTQFSDFTPIKEGSGVFKYLEARAIPSFLHTNIYQAKYWRNEDEFEWVICMLNRRGSKILGMQVRNLKVGKRRWFKIYNYENLLEWVNIIKEDKIEIDINQMVLYNKLSYYFNILNINVSTKITVFEGYLDSLFYPNSIGLVGTNTDAKLIENNGLDIQYFYDNDSAGDKKSQEKIRIGIPVFLWNKLFEDIVNKKNSSDPYKLLHRVKKVKDLNKLAELVPNPYKKLSLDDFFSQDILDIKWIPKVKWKIEEKEIDYNKKFDNLNL